MYGRRLSKADPRVDAYGCVDELSAALGLARSVAVDNFLSDQILAAQRDLIIVMGELATAPSDHERYAKDGFHLTTTEMVDRITSVVFDLEKDKSLYPKDWSCPVGRRFLRHWILLAQYAAVQSVRLPHSVPKKKI